MNPALLDTQFADLEEPGSSENVLTVELGESPGQLVEKIKASLREQSR
jgi:gluconate kinase